MNPDDKKKRKGQKIEKNSRAQNPMDDKLGNKEEHEGSYSKINPYLGNYSLETEKFVAKRYIKNFKGKKILEFGFGQGELLAYMASRGAEAYGIELSSKAEGLLAAKKNLYKLAAGNDIKTYFGSFSKLPFESGFFDAIVSFHVLEHIEDEKNMVEEFRRVLKPEGIVLIGVPRVEEGREDKPEFFHTKFHYREYSRKTLEKTFAEKFDIIRLDHYDNAINTAAKTFIHNIIPSIIRKKAAAKTTPENGNSAQDFPIPQRNKSFKATIHRKAVAIAGALNHLDMLLPENGDSLVILAKKK